MKSPNYLVACRIGSYGHYVDEAWTHLPSLGIRHIETKCPSDEELPVLKKKVVDHGMQVSSFHCPCDIKGEDVVGKMKSQFDCFAEFDTKVCFTSVHAGDTPRDLVWDRLREIGDAAAARDITVSMETHPDLVENSRNARTTMESVRHPNIRVNFDTANVYYYNQGISGIEELKQTAEFVGSIHLKDTTGEYRTTKFPTLGDGIVDFPAVFDLMGSRGFKGPFTIELEGHEVRDKQGQLEHVANSIEYLRSIGAL